MRPGEIIRSFWCSPWPILPGSRFRGRAKWT